MNDSPKYGIKYMKRGMKTPTYLWFFSKEKRDSVYLEKKNSNQYYGVKQLNR